MSSKDVEIELKRWRNPDEEVKASAAQQLSIEEALAYRNAGNLPDAQGRSLRLVLHVNDAAELSYLQEKRLEFEPDFHDAPSWRKEGSKPVNVVPLRRDDVVGDGGRAWWEDPDVAALETEWMATGSVAGMRVPADVRSFVYKTVLSLRAAGREVNPDSVADSIARWMSPKEAEQIRASLKQT
ncbi:MAG: hypothetical protein QOG04_1035 [Actinomycetota bacterium]|jgi:hypothetical protein|nr:hypothetical protein [Actinomycetota bacterium]